MQVPMKNLEILQQLLGYKAENFLTIYVCVCVYTYIYNYDLDNQILG